MPIPDSGLLRPMLSIDVVHRGGSGSPVPPHDPFGERDTRRMGSGARITRATPVVERTGLREMTRTGGRDILIQAGISSIFLQ